MESDSDGDAGGAPRAFRSVFDHLRSLTPAAVDRLYGKGTSLDPAVF